MTLCKTPPLGRCCCCCYCCCCCCCCIHAGHVLYGRYLRYIKRGLTRLVRKRRDLAQLSSLGHFLKGSSATLGLTKVKDSCEKIQWYGMHKDESGSNEEPSDDVCLSRIETTLAAVKDDYRDVEKALKAYYEPLEL